MGVLSKGVGILADWIEAGYPEGVAWRIVNGYLPMDEASRLVRARSRVTATRFMLATAFPGRC